MDSLHSLNMIIELKLIYYQEIDVPYFTFPVNVTDFNVIEKILDMLVRYVKSKCEDRISLASLNDQFGLN